MTDKYELFLSAINFLKEDTRSGGYSLPYVYLTQKFGENQTLYRQIESKLWASGFVETSNHSEHSMKISDKGAEASPPELRRAYLGLKPEKELPYEELYREILQWIIDKGDSHLEPILEDIGINQSKANGIQGVLDTKLGYIKCHDLGCHVTDVGEAFLYGFSEPLTTKKGGDTHVYLTDNIGQVAVGDNATFGDNKPKIKSDSEESLGIAKKGLLLAKWQTRYALIGIALILLGWLLQYYKIWPFR